MSETIFELRDVYFSYLGKFLALQGINLDIEKGQKIAIIGCNGSGKTTLLHLLDGLIFADKGYVKFFGEELNEKSFNNKEFSRLFRRTMGLVFQNPDVQLFCPTVKEDILFGPLQLGFGQEEIKKRFEKLVSILNIKDLLDRSPHQLSIGEKHKVAIVSTLIIDPDILLLDEPSAGLDPLTTRNIIDLLIQEGVDKMIITSTHDLDIVEEIADFVYVLSPDKRIIKSGQTDVVLKDTELLRENNLVYLHSHHHKDKIHIHSHLHLNHHAE
ncbi:MAG: nickel ABC transporter ATP-binding protein [Caldiserica bacterium CG02_land_8_20_14_3_00_36_38]|nr:MAG: nickel ABC transporter ATP-binding protein [Caldiserica bacterium CG02_land_8_20_14_3_00_36_38]